jgi:hypothetical protein
VSARRWMDAPAVDSWLTQRLQHDPEATAPREAAAALGLREPTRATIAAEQRAFRTEREEGVWLALRSNLGHALEAFPELQPFIRQAAASDPSPEVRGAAGTLLAQSPHRS